MTESEIDELSEEFRIELQSTAGDAEYDTEDELLGEDTTANLAHIEDMPAHQQQMPARQQQMPARQQQIPARQQQIPAPRDQQRQIPPALPVFLAQQQQNYVLPQMPAPPQMLAMPAPPQMPVPPQMLTLMPPPNAPPNRLLLDILKDFRLIKIMLNSLVNQRQVPVSQKNYRKIISNTFYRIIGHQGKEIREDLGITTPVETLAPTML